MLAVCVSLRDPTSRKSKPACERFGSSRPSVILVRTHGFVDRLLEFDELFISSVKDEVEQSDGFREIHYRPVIEGNELHFLWRKGFIGIAGRNTDQEQQMDRPIMTESDIAVQKGPRVGVTYHLTGCVNGYVLA